MVTHTANPCHGDNPQYSLPIVRRSPRKKRGCSTAVQIGKWNAGGAKISAAAIAALSAIDASRTTASATRAAIGRQIAQTGARPIASAPTSGIAWRGPVELPPSQ
ncbi:hypothetical protein [Sphingomonas faeni]|uniref:hypothetical protein n=1 Tax=Sphingomonas faeni TaxID=185950 RepID=UPI003363A914